MSSNYKEISGYNEEQLGKDRASRMSQVAMYSEMAHFVYELLQNADDAEATEIRFSVSQTSLVVEHNGKSFTEDNVKAISYFGKGKTDITKIGHFGLGFKSVFAYTASPRVHSGDESFEITELYSLDGIHYPSDLELGKTRFIFPFDHEIKKPNYIEKGKLKTSGIAYSEIADKLSKLSAETLLFTKSLTEIRWETEQHKGHYLREIKPVQTQDKNIVKEMYIVPSDGADYCYLIVERPIEWPGDDGIKKEHRPVQIAFRLDKRLKDGGAIRKVENARLFVFFPTVIETHVGFILQGPYRTTPQRETVPAGDEFNQHVVEQSASLLSDSLGYIRDLGLLNVASYAALPLRALDFPEGSLFRPVYDRVREALKTQPLLPAQGGGFIKADEAKLARGKELVELFSPEQLGSLFGKAQLEWLDDSITENGTTADFHRYLKDVVEEIQPSELKDKLTTSFFEIQSEEWLRDFYEYLGRKQNYNLFRSVPFERREDNLHVLPGVSDKPNAWLPPVNVADIDQTIFPLIKRSLASDPVIDKFLRETAKLREPDKVDVVIQCRLRKYAEGTWQFNQNDYVRDLKEISVAYSNAKPDDASRLIAKLKETSFVAAVPAGNPQGGAVVGMKPGDQTLYCQSPELEQWFAGNEKDKAYFPLSVVSEHLASDVQSKLGFAIASLVKRSPQSAYKRPQGGFDAEADIFGLEWAVSHSTHERAVFLWNKLIEYKDLIQGEEWKCNNMQFPVDKIKKYCGYSKLGKACAQHAWLPQAGDFYRPEQILLTELPDGFEKSTPRAESLARALGMKHTVDMSPIAAAYGITPEEAERRMSVTPEEMKELEQRRQEKLSSPTLPDRISPDPERREKKIDEEARNTPAKTTEIRPRSVNPYYPEAQGDARAYLAHQYTNGDGIMFCQLCQAPQPVMLNGEPHFEAVDCVGGVNAHHEQNNLALCPNHAAMYKNGGLTPETVQRAILECEGQKIPLNLAGNEVELYFTQQHLGDLCAVLNALYPDEI